MCVPLASTTNSVAAVMSGKASCVAYDEAVFALNKAIRQFCSPAQGLIPWSGVHQSEQGL